MVYLWHTRLSSRVLFITIYRASDRAMSQFIELIGTTQRYRDLYIYCGSSPSLEAHDAEYVRSIKHGR